MDGATLSTRGGTTVGTQLSWTGQPAGGDARGCNDAVAGGTATVVGGYGDNGTSPVGWTLRDAMLTGVASCCSMCGLITHREKVGLPGATHGRASARVGTGKDIHEYLRI